MEMPNPGQVHTCHLEFSFLESYGFKAAYYLEGMGWDR